MEELEDLTIRPTDLLLLAAVNDEDYNHLDVCIKDQDLFLCLRFLLLFSVYLLLSLDIII